MEQVITWGHFDRAMIHGTPTNGTIIIMVSNLLRSSISHALNKDERPRIARLCFDEISAIEIEDSEVSATDTQEGIQLVMFGLTKNPHTQQATVASEDCTESALNKVQLVKQAFPFDGRSEYLSLVDDIIDATLEDIDKKYT